MITKEGIAFETYPAICVPQARQRFDTGHAYITAPSAKVFTHIVEAQLEHVEKSA